MKLPFIFFWGTIAITAVFLTGCRSNDLDRELIVGRQWTRNLDNGSFTGFYLTPDQRVLLINDSAFTGEQWRFKQDKLILWKYAEATHSSIEYGYYFELNDQTLVLRPDDGGDKMLFYDNRISIPVDVPEWVAAYLDIPKEIDAPGVQKVRLRFNADSGRVDILINDKKICADYKITPPVRIEFSNLPAPDTVPLTDFQSGVLDLLDSANTLILCRETLILYRGSKMLAAFNAKYD